MTSDEQRLRADLRTLAGSEQGRRLLQLGLRGIGRGERDVTAGCWVKRGDAGCLFQHAYWEGVREGVFADKGRPAVCREVAPPLEDKAPAHLAACHFGGDPDQPSNS